jgi:trehalose 6-phosphate synthase/phosphatase
VARIINVSNRLPVTISGDDFEKSSGGLVAALEAVTDGEHELKWIGWPGGEVEQPRQAEVERLLNEQYGCTPVFLADEQVKRFYEGFANSSLWPLLHYMPSRFHYQRDWWEEYQQVNRQFADRVLESAGPDDMVWVHDYQLMLLPAMLREAMPSLKIGFFLHTPFPSYEVFRCHPQRAELVAGLLGADLVGFHTFGYVRHFKSAALRLLGIEAEMLRMRHGGRTTQLGIYPIGINAVRFEQELDSPQFHESLRKAAAAYQGKKVVLSVERLDYTKGLLHRLDAIDQFLDRSEDRDRIQFIFISVPSREAIEEYQQLIEEVQSTIGRLNGRYATLHNSPIHFIHGTVEFTDLCALYALADVGLVTPLIDGMNLVAKEYIACQRQNPGVLVLSEFAGAAEELFNALLVNPYDGKALADALEHALRMTPWQRGALMEPMRRRVLQWDAGNWARAFIKDLGEQPGLMHAEPDIGDARRLVSEAIGAGRRLAFFIDYDGTLREIVTDPRAAWPTDEIHAILGRLQRQENIDVTIISGRISDELEAWLGGYPFGLIAEHGANIRPAGEAGWERLDQSISYAWKEQILKVLRIYESSTPGSFVEEKRTSLVWHYRRADPEFGAWKANQLTDELVNVSANDPLHIRHGKKIVEVSATQINKGAAITRLLERNRYDLVVVAGDDLTDESMYQLDIPNLVSIRVGAGDTRARYRVDNPAAFRRFLHQALAASPAAAGWPAGANQA